MTISAISAVAPISNGAMNSGISVAPTPEQSELEHFNQLMFNTGHQVPEQDVVDHIQNGYSDRVRGLSAVTHIDPQALSTDEMLKAQSQLLNVSVSIDLGAKLAGQLSQAVNKLVSMQ